MSQDTNKQTAEKLFASTTHQVLFANKKGEFFTSEDNVKLSLKNGEKFEKFERKSESSDDDKVFELNSKDTIAKIKETTSIEELSVFDGDERKSVIAEFEKQTAKLVAATEVDSSSSVDEN